MTAPIHIDNECVECGAPLKQFEVNGRQFTDEWVCSVGCDGMYLDWHKRQMRKTFGTPLGNWFSRKKFRIAFWICGHLGHTPPEGSHWLDSCNRCGIVLEFNS